MSSTSFCCVRLALFRRWGHGDCVPLWWQEAPLTWLKLQGFSREAAKKKSKHTLGSVSRLTLNHLIFQTGNNSMINSAACLPEGATESCWNQRSSPVSLCSSVERRPVPWVTAGVQSCCGTHSVWKKSAALVYSDRALSPFLHLK